VATAATAATPTEVAATAAAVETSRSQGVRTPLAIHVALAAWIVLLLGLANYAPLLYSSLVQEDRFIEWWTVLLFGAAGVALLYRAVTQRRIFDVLVAAFCLFVAGEEFSWGQRLFGFTPPDLFLEHNTQQEFTLHNFSAIFGKPKGVLMIALFAYGVLLPAIERLRPGLLQRRPSATPPPLNLAPWYLAAVGLLYWYPVEFTGEWVEAMAGGLFFVSARPKPIRLVSLVGATALGALALSFLSARSLAAHPAAVGCAQREVSALVADLKGAAAAPRLRNGNGSVHKRVWTAIQDHYIRSDSLSNYALAACTSAPRYMIDPWGIAYWIRVPPTADGVRVFSIYSMGPNRRRDHAPGSETQGDDIVVTGTLGH
jgi:hypothetical protein